MRSFCTRGVAAAASLLLAAGSALAQGYGSPTLLPLPDDSPANGAPSRSYGYGGRLTSVVEPTPVEAVPTPQPDSQTSSSAYGEDSATGQHAADAGCCDNTSTCDGNLLGPWCGPGCNCGWFGSVGGMVLTRDHANPFWTSYESANNANQIMNTNNADANWNGGGFVSFGKWFGNNCGCDPCGQCNSCGPRCGIEAVYFTVAPLQGYSNVNAADPAGGDYVSSTLDFNTQTGQVQFPNGRNVSDYFDNAMQQRIWRSDYIQNVEINFLNQYWNAGSRCQVTFLSGIRWFHFGEDLIYGSVAGQNAIYNGPNNSFFGNNNGVDEAFMRFKCVNDLVGFQLGARADYYFGQRFSLFATPKFGIYGNHISGTNQVYTGDGSSLYNFHQTTNGVSFLGQIDVGASYRVTQNWRAFMGYRAIAVTGLALGDNQIPHYLAATDELQQIKHNGDVVLHGGFAGLEFCF